MARQTTETAAQRRDLARMRERLDEWRSGHARGVAFPPKLWSAAGRLARRHGVYVTARALGLEYNKLKAASGAGVARVTGTRAVRSAPKPIKLVELTGMLPTSPGGCRVSLRGPVGERLQLEMAPGAATEMVLQLCRSGWSASP